MGQRMTGAKPDPGFRYWAFISYSHQDASWGRWLHKALETYRVPPRLIGMPIAAGSVPARLTPIFRDRDELPTATDLGFTIEEALRQSWCLIVICSPASARSRWVNEEVLAFQKLGHAERIFCLIVEGNEDAAATPCFPPALVERMSAAGTARGEPIAADARRHGDGRAHARLKLISGMLGVGFDKLVQREQQRRIRNLALTTIAAVLVMSMLAVFSVVTINSRRDAESQRSHAEGLVEFMLGDLRKRLEPDGKLATLDAVGKEALAYYAAQNPETLDADALARRARALQQIGEVYNLRGQLDEALGVFEQASATTAELLARDESNPQRIFDHAQSVYWVGYVAYQRADIGLAEVKFTEYRRLAEKLVLLDSMKADWQAELGYANSNLGTLLYDQGRLDEASSIFERELELAQAQSHAAATNYSRQVRVAQARAWLGDVRFSQGELQDASDQRQAEIAVYSDALSRDPKNNDAKAGLAVSQRTLAQIMLGRGELSTAGEFAERSRAAAVELTELDPENSSWLANATSSLAMSSEIRRINGDERGALDAAAFAGQLASKLVKRDAGVAAWQLRWVEATTQQAKVLASTGKSLDALNIAQVALQRLQALPATKMDQPQTLAATAQLLLLVGEQYSILNRRDEAARTYQRIVNELHDVGRGLTFRNQILLAAALSHLDRHEESESIANKFRTKGFRDVRFPELLIP